MFQKVTILIPNYKTPDLTKLCLRLLRLYTSLEKIKVIVIDNHSQDASLDYLRSLSWIELIEREIDPHESPVQAHSRALDIALEKVQTPYVLSIHTDTLVKHPEWLEFLLSTIEKDAQIAGVGSWKLECKSHVRLFLKWLEKKWQKIFVWMTNNKKTKEEKYLYLRSHCALYRTDLLKKFNLHFSDGDMVAGKAMHRALVDAGYEMIFLASDVLIRYLDHVNHATTVLNPHLSHHHNSVSKGLRRIEKSLASVRASDVLADVGLD